MRLKRGHQALIVLTGATIFAFGVAAHAAEGTLAQASKHSEHSAPDAHIVSAFHGGQMTQTTQHSFETVFASDGIRVYVYTKEHVPMMVEGLAGTATLKFNAGVFRKVALAAESPKDGEPTVYFCPMHPASVQMEPGVCVECGGMNLYAQDRLRANVDLTKFESAVMRVVFEIKGLPEGEREVAFTAAHRVPVGGKGIAPKARSGHVH